MKNKESSQALSQGELASGGHTEPKKLSIAKQIVASGMCLRTVSTTSHNASVEVCRCQRLGRVARSTNDQLKQRQQPPFIY
eukprot:1343637-Amphidinium_carterae.1